MAFLQAKRGWERQRRRENKNYRFDQFLPNPEQRIQKKKSKKTQKIKKHHYGFFSSQNRLGKDVNKRK